jgi:hypothetical protein
VSVQFYALWGPQDHPELGEAADFSSANGRAVLELLGYRPGSDLAGEDSPDEFLAKVRRAGMRVANVTGADDGESATSGRGRLGARWVDCGRRDGYFAERLPALEQVAREAKKHGGMVVWA